MCDTRQRKDSHGGIVRVRLLVRLVVQENDCSVRVVSVDY